jgi:hypothetical protein
MIGRLQAERVEALREPEAGLAIAGVRRPMHTGVEVGLYVGHEPLGGERVDDTRLRERGGHLPRGGRGQCACAE